VSPQQEQEVVALAVEELVEMVQRWPEEPDILAPVLEEKGFVEVVLQLQTLEEFPVLVPEWRQGCLLHLTCLASFASISPCS